jgi:hypothetical protein
MGNGYEELNRDAVMKRRMPRMMPLILEWRSADSPLPRFPIRIRGRSTAMPFGLGAPPYLSTGPADQPFDFCGHVRRLSESVVSRMDELRHIDVSRVLFTVTQSRSGRPHGLQARVTPLRFRGGELSRRHRGFEYQVQRFRVDGREMFYIMTFCLPRFLDQDFDQKFITLFHELFHIGPEFNGDLRRHEGRYRIHTHSQKEYDERMADLARQYLRGNPNPELHAFLRLNFAQLRHRHGEVVGIKVPRPKLLPLRNAARDR